MRENLFSKFGLKRVVNKKIFPLYSYRDRKKVQWPTNSWVIQLYIYLYILFFTHKLACLQKVEQLASFFKRSCIKVSSSHYHLQLLFLLSHLSMQKMSISTFVPQQPNAVRIAVFYFCIKCT